MLVADTAVMQRHRHTVAEYMRMGDAGVLPADARVELIDGEVFDMAPIGTRHARAVRRLTMRLVPAVGGRAEVSVQNPVVLGPHDMPQPDIALVRPEPDSGAARHPTAEDILLIVEVADSTAAADRRVKAPLYARARVPELWIIDLEARLLRLYRRPQGNRYADVDSIADPGMTPVLMLPGVAVDLSKILD